MKRRVLLILAMFFIGASMHINAQTINYVLTKMVDASGRVMAPSGWNNNCPFIFEGDRIYQYEKTRMLVGDGTDGYRLYKRENGKYIYFYYCSGTTGGYLGGPLTRISQPYWDFTRAIIVSSDKKTINVCSYDNSGNLKLASVYKVPTAPGASDFIE